METARRLCQIATGPFITPPARHPVAGPGAVIADRIQSTNITMSYDDWPDNTMDNRRAVVRKTIRPAPLQELKDLGAKQFPVVTDPWCERYNAFLAKNANAKFYLAKTPEGAEVVYCRETGDGIWFLPGKGMGIVQPNGLKMLAEIVDAR
jgi:hypothetical protein